ncbi:hypothetical protein PG985_000053 [Apiospora marii]|uniref:uncharacterized protein n=1 Tax=Apiospora marii TaxID=335849 RepID=UPI0031318B3A
MLGPAAIRVVHLVDGQVLSGHGHAVLAAVGAVAFVVVAGGLSEIGEVVAAAGAAGSMGVSVGCGVLDALVGLELAWLTHVGERVEVQLYSWMCFVTVLEYDGDWSC